jgi:hypothetical protein
MNLKKININKYDAAKYLKLLAIFLTAVALIRIILFFTESSVTAQVQHVTAKSVLDEKQIDSIVEKDRKRTQAIKENNRFSPLPPKRNPVSSVQGILGKQVLINGKWYNQGDSVGDAKILQIETARVKISWQGNEKYFAPIGNVTQNSPPAKAPQTPKQRPGHKGREQKSVKKQIRQTQTPQDNDPLAWVGVKLSAEMRAKFLEQWNQMSDEQKEQAKAQWSQMSQEEKENAVKAMESHM